MIPEKEVVVRSPAATRRVVAALARRLPAGSVVALSGELGAGKTTFVQGLALGLGVRRPVTSPTFALAAEYEGRRGRLVHLDLFRLSGSDALGAAGLDEYLNCGALVAVEWPERAGGVLPPDCVWVRLATLAGGRRRIRIRAGRPGALPETASS